MALPLNEEAENQDCGRGAGDEIEPLVDAGVESEVVREHSAKASKH
jgi:hypothetical protein